MPEGLLVVGSHWQPGSLISFQPEILYLIAKSRFPPTGGILYSVFERASYFWSVVAPVSKTRESPRLLYSIHIIPVSQGPDSVWTRVNRGGAGIALCNINPCVDSVR